MAGAVVRTLDVCVLLAASYVLGYLSHAVLTVPQAIALLRGAL